MSANPELPGFNPDYEDEDRLPVSLDGRRVLTEPPIDSPHRGAELGTFAVSEENEPPTVTLSLDRHTINATELVAYKDHMRARVGRIPDLRVSRRKGFRLPERVALESLGAEVTRERRGVPHEMSINRIKS